MDNHLLTLLQLGDSNFPSGAFSHSYGLETYIQEGTVHNRATLFHWLRIYLEKQLATTDGIAFRMAYDFLKEEKLEELWMLDQKLFVQNMPEESRQANRRIGERLIKMGIELYSVPLLKQFLKKIQLREANSHPALAMAIICHFLKINQHEALNTFLYSTVSTLIQNGVRGIPLGQTAGQRILLEMGPYIIKTSERIEKLDADEFGAIVPGVEIAQMRHERLHVRLFMS